MPFCGYGFLIGFALGCVLSYFGDAKLGVAVMVIIFFLGVVGDMTQMGWRFFWAWTQVCGHCGKRVSPLTRARVRDDLKGSKYWFCSPRCYMEFSRRFKAEGKLFNFLFEKGD